MSGAINFLLTNPVTTGTVHGVITPLGVNHFYSGDHKKREIALAFGGIINTIHAYSTLLLVNNALTTNASLAAHVGVGSVSLWFAAVPLTAILFYQIAKCAVGDKKAVNATNGIQKSFAWVLAAISVASVAVAAIGGQWLFVGIYAIFVANSLKIGAERRAMDSSAALHRRVIETMETP